MTIGFTLLCGIAYPLVVTGVGQAMMPHQANGSLIVDEGPGLPEGDPARLFDRFTRVEGSDRTGGSGLGLANVKGFADVMGLAVSAHNEPGHGASFVIAWPGAMMTDEAS